MDIWQKLDSLEHGATLCVSKAGSIWTAELELEDSYYAPVYQGSSESIEEAIRKAIAAMEELEE